MDHFVLLVHEVLVGADLLQDPLSWIDRGPAVFFEQWEEQEKDAA